MSQAEFYLWLARYQRAPFGEIRDDLRNGLSNYYMASLWGKRKPRWDDCLLNFEGKDKKKKRSMQEWAAEYAR